MEYSDLTNPKWLETINVLCLGCSFTKGKYPEYNYPTHLQNILPKEYKVHNFGRGASGTRLHLLLSKFYIPIDPQYVIIQLMHPWRHHLFMKIIRINPHLISDILQSDSYPEALAAIHRAHQEVLYKGKKRVQIDRMVTTGELEQLITDDMINIFRLTSLFDCPVILLINDNAYPYYNSFPFALVKLLTLAKTEKIVITSFSASNEFWLSENDRHPNEKRAKMTAQRLAKEIL